MNKQIKILSLILIVLFCTIFIVNTIDNKEKNKNGDHRFFNFTQDKVASFQVNNFISGQLFKKTKDGAWLVKEVKNKLAKSIEKKEGSTTDKKDKVFKPARSVEVAKALTYLMELKNLKPISTQKSGSSLFEINKYSLHVILFDKNGKTLEKVYIGKHGPEPLTSFLKKEGSDKIYLVKQNFKLLFFRDFKDWLANKK